MLKMLDEDPGLAAMLDVLEQAEGLVKQQGEDLSKLECDLPLLESGQELKASEVKVGFRVRKGVKLQNSIYNDFKVEGTPSDADEFDSIIVRHESGASFSYWTDCFFDGKTLAECVIDYGLGGFETKDGVKIKVCYLDDTRSLSNSFKLFGVRNDCQLVLKQSELACGVYRVYRSSLPPTVARAIAARELLNLREDCRVDEPRFWHM